MKTATKANRSGFMAGAAAMLVFAGMGFTGAVQARDNIYWTVGVGSPGVGVNVGNARPVYIQPQPVYVQPAPVYIQPQPVYIQPQPVYVQPRPYYQYGQPQVVYVQPGYGNGHRHGWHKKHGHDRDDDDRGDRRGYGYRQGYAPIYYQR